MIGDGSSRGQTLEIILSKIRYFSQLKKIPIQIVGMSATIK
jgi:replicative superfamily II helicase